MKIDENILTIMGTTIRCLNYADAARDTFIIMYGDRHIPEFDFEKDDDGNMYLSIYMEDKDCLRIKRVIACENILSAKNPVKVVYKELEDMREELRSYEVKGDK